MEEMMKQEMIPEERKKRERQREGGGGEREMGRKRRNRPSGGTLSWSVSLMEDQCVHSELAGAGAVC